MSDETSSSSPQEGGAVFPIDIRPEAALEEIQDFGQSLVDGLRNLSELGEVSAGCTPRKCVYQTDRVQLVRYEPDAPKQQKIPVLIVYALVNRPYMADLQDNRSLVRGLLNAGLDVYLIDWGYPDSADRNLGLDDYINGYIDRCVSFICKSHGIDAVNLLGICQGGTFSTCYSALHPERVRNLITTVTPIDFHAEGDMLSHWVRNVDINLLVDTLGNVPGEWLNLTFLGLKPYRLSGQKYLDMVNALKDHNSAMNFMRMEKWIFDSPDQVAEAYREFMINFYQKNGLVKGTVEIGGQRVDLKNVSMPVLNIFARDDHLVPTESSKALEKLVGTKDYTAIEFPGGHIGIYVSGNAQKLIPPSVGKWLAAR
jgi:polyhydroxyalkanoate synthase subunit PhaC